MPAWIIPAVAAALAALPFVVIGIRVAAPLVLPGWFKSIAPERRAQIVGAVKGAADIVTAVSKTTTNNIDDQIAEILNVIAIEGGKTLTTAERAHAQSVAESVLAKRSGILSTSAAAKAAKAGVSLNLARHEGKVAE